MKVRPAMVKSVSGRHLDILVRRLPGMRLSHIQANMEHKGLIQIQLALQELKVLLYALRAIYCCVAVLPQGLHSNVSRCQDRRVPFHPGLIILLKVLQVSSSCVAMQSLTDRLPAQAWTRSVQLCPCASLWRSLTSCSTPVYAHDTTCLVVTSFA